MKKPTMIATVVFATIAALSFYSATSHARTPLPEPTVWFQPLPIVCGMHTEYQAGGGMYPYPVFNTDKRVVELGCSVAWVKNLANLIDYVREVNLRPELENWRTGELKWISNHLVLFAPSSSAFATPPA